ncbi:MAG: NADH-quinone oxidoreductase subunit C [Candidatus Atribacteria bacterium]|nr:NADH-quinone oxidoreductase subunit C [Candidatus Atribacteria bacterium]
MELLKKKLLYSFNGLKIDIRDKTRMFIDTEKEIILSLLSYLKNMRYEHLSIVACTDWIDQGVFELVYIVSAYMSDDDIVQEKEKSKIIIKTKISRETANFMTIIGIYENAEPYERELHEMFGIVFEGHPRLTPLMLERDYEIPPFRKDFITMEYVENTFGKIPSIEQRKKEAK